MLEITNADEMARKTLKEVLKDEVRKVNAHINNAQKSKQYFCSIQSDFSEATIYLLKKAGYTVKVDYGNGIEISWYNQYNRYEHDTEIVDQLADELQLKIIGTETNNSPKNGEG